MPRKFLLQKLYSDRKQRGFFRLAFGLANGGSSAGWKKSFQCFFLLLLRGRGEVENERWGGGVKRYIAKLPKALFSPLCGDGGGRCFISLTSHSKGSLPLCLMRTITPREGGKTSLPSGFHNMCGLHFKS